MNNRTRRNTSNPPPKSGPGVIKISKNILFLILGFSIMNFITAFFCLAITLFTPVKVTKSISAVEKQLNELTRLWQAGGLNSNTQVQLPSKENTETIVEKVPNIEDEYIKEELNAIAKSVKESIESSGVVDAMLELDASGLNVKGDTSNIQIDSVSDMEKVMRDIKDNNKYINKMFFGTKSENFVVVPTAKASDSYKPTEEQWYKLAEGTPGEVKWSQIKQDEFTKEYIITGSITIVNKNRIIGVVGVQVSLTKMR